MTGRRVEPQAQIWIKPVGSDVWLDPAKFEGYVELEGQRYTVVFASGKTAETKDQPTKRGIAMAEKNRRKRVSKAEHAEALRVVDALQKEQARSAAQIAELKTMQDGIIALMRYIEDACAARLNPPVLYDDSLVSEGFAHNFNTRMAGSAASRRSRCRGRVP